MEDPRGIGVTTASTATLHALASFEEAMLGKKATVVALLGAAEADTEAPMLQTYAAILAMLGEHMEAVVPASQYLARAEQQWDRANDHERQLIRAAAAWIRDGDCSRAFAMHDDIARDYPLDLVSMLIGQYHALSQGNFAGMLRLVDRVRPVHGRRRYLDAHRAFPLEELQELAAAEVAARDGLEIDPGDAWAHHAMAHLMDASCRPIEAVALMEAASSSWSDCNSFMYTHNWWHLALYLIDREDIAGALRLFDERIWAHTRTYSQDQANAIALLARLDLLGADVGDRWREVTDHVAQRVPDVVQPFLALHYILALTSDRRDEMRLAAAEQFAAVCAAAAEAPVAVRAAWSEVAVPMGRGMIARRDGAYDEAADHFTRALSRLILIGGSHAQRDLFHQLAVDALIRSRRLMEAQQVLVRRRGERPDVVHTRRLLSGVYQAMAVLPPALL